ncbi:hypothetical protein [Paenibacillus tarimensis]|uniref:hypothetical protein n=1 Tax=Paenibacillus tarimensis TaxID=416012 RepID=UPI001F19DB6C|nr:hypothetical protein [Paenibacillus tarimensis]MCF2943066.1 hypothetical protein [Paenibacillus tarimensis]
MWNLRTRMNKREVGSGGYLPLLAAVILLAALTACQPDRTNQEPVDSIEGQTEGQDKMTPQETAEGLVVELNNHSGRLLAGLSLQYPGGLLALTPIAAGEDIRVTVIPDLEQGGELRLLYRDSADQVKSLTLPGLLSGETEGPIRVPIHTDGAEGLQLINAS